MLERFPGDGNSVMNGDGMWEPYKCKHTSSFTLKKNAVINLKEIIKFYLMYWKKGRLTKKQWNQVQICLAE